MTNDDYSKFLKKSQFLEEIPGSYKDSLADPLSSKTLTPEKESECSASVCDVPRFPEVPSTNIFSLNLEKTVARIDAEAAIHIKKQRRESS